MRPFLFLGVLGVLAIGGFFVFSSSKPGTESKILTTPTPQVQAETERRASFAIFTNGTFRIFTDPKYHNLSDDVYIESTNPNIVLIQREGITWNDFFKTLPM